LSFSLQKPGDYRIPKAAETNPDGSRIDISTYLPNKGIIRGNNKCTWDGDWNAYQCSDMDHHMAIIESLDPDTETRRLSPVAILGKKDFPCYLEAHLFLWKNQQFLHVRYLMGPFYQYWSPMQYP
jgi:hypothetical protein